MDFEYLFALLCSGVVKGSIYALIALGYTMVLPDEDKYSQTRSELLDKLSYMLGGRAAEELMRFSMGFGPST